MEPSISRRPNNRITITIHDISWESKMRFKGLCAVLNKSQYEVFNEIVDFYWNNIKLTVPKRQQAAIVRKLLDEIYKVAEDKHTL
jgi:hypothetical protein